MDQIIVTVKRLGETQVHDIEFATNIPISQLITTLVQALGWEYGANGQALEYTPEAHPPGRFLRLDETLAQAQVWDGAWLILHPKPRAMGQAAVSTPTSAAITHPSVATPAPTSAWKPLDIQKPSSSPQINSSASSTPLVDPGPGYVWKRVDED